MNPFKSSVVDDNEESASVRTRPEEKTTMLSGEILTAVSGGVSEDSRETTYLERKSLAAQGIWGRVKEMPNGCWEWQGGTNGEGYGVVCFRKKTHYIHRVICELFNRPLLVTEEACHSCNNPVCCNPKHLSPGTRFDNTHDHAEYCGRGRPQTVTPELMAEARTLYAGGGWTFAQLGKRYGVSGAAMSARLKGVKRPDTWARKKRTEWPQAQEAIALYEQGGWSVARLAKHFGKSATIVRDRLNGAVRPDRKPGSGRTTDGR